MSNVSIDEFRFYRKHDDCLIQYSDNRGDDENSVSHISLNFTKSANGTWATASK